MKRESGWYRVKYKNYQTDGYGEIEGNYEVVLYNSEHNCFYIPDGYGNTIDVQEDYFAYVDPQMVMTTSGEVVYYNNKIDRTGEEGWYYGEHIHSNLKVIGFYDGESFIVPDFITPDTDLDDFIIYCKIMDSEGNFDYDNIFNASRKATESI